MENLVKLLSEEDKEKLRRILYNEYYVKYRNEHREIINLHNGRGVICEYCGRQVNKSNLPRHHKSWKCTQTRITNKPDQNITYNQTKQKQDNDVTEEYKSEYIIF